MHKIIVLNELIITDDKESYEFIKISQQWAATAKHSVILVYSNSNSESDNNETDNLKTDELTKLNQREIKAE